MAKKLKKSSKINKTIKWYRGSKWWVKGLSVLLIVILGVTTNNAYQQKQLESKFASLETTLDLLSHELDTVIPEMKSKKTCFVLIKS